MKKVSMYIDGYNFYYAIKKGLVHIAPDLLGLGWCDFRELGEKCMTRDDETIDQVKYFTARVGSCGFRAEIMKQNVWIDAIRSIKNLTVIEGVHQLEQGHRPKDRKEKMTDVNIAVDLLLDASDPNRFDKAIIVSADLDLYPAALAAVERIENPIEVEFWFPPTLKAPKLESLCKKSGIKCERITPEMLFKYRLPDEIIRDGKKICIDPSWKISEETKHSFKVGKL